MSNSDFEFSLDDILAEFHASENESLHEEVVRPAVIEAKAEETPFEEPVRRRVEEPRYTQDRSEPAEVNRMSPEEKLEMYKRAQQSRRKSSELMHEDEGGNKFNMLRHEELAPKASKAKKQKKTFKEEAVAEKRQPPERKRANGKMLLVSMCAYAVLMLWGVFNLHPGASLPKPTLTPVVPTPVVNETPVETPDAQPVDQTQQEEVAPVPTEPPKPHYTIAEGSVIAPKANPDNFGSVPVASAAQLDAVIQQARDSGLLKEDEKMVFDSSLAFNTGSYYQDIKYYYDETTLAIAWKQIVDGNTVTCMEVKVADASQFRRKITGDAYGSPVDYLSNLNKSTNAVVSMNADFYQFRDYGVMVYDGVLYKCTDKRYLVHNGVDYKWYNCLDNCFITRDGDMIFTYFGEEFTWESMQQFIDDNNISFSLSFGPILVDNYEAQTHYADWYPVGEVDQGYSRAGFGQVDERHYLYMSLNHSDEKSARWTMLEFGQFFQSRGVEKAYAFDGGQTSEIIFNGEIYNHIDKSSERWVSDMVYFGTAIPEEVWNNG